MAGTKTNLKLLMTTDTVGGVWTYCMELCSALQAYGAAVHLVTMGEKMKDWQREDAQALENVVVHETTYKLEWMQDPWPDVIACGDYLLQLEKELQPDLIHLNCFAYGSFPFKAPVVVVAHSDVWSWFGAVKGTTPDSEWQDYFSWVKNGLHGADKVIAPSEESLQVIRAIYDLTDGVFIHNGRNENHFQAARKQPVVFSMGRLWDEAKNTKLLMDAAPLIEAPVRIAGENRFAQNSLDASGNAVEFLGKLSTQQIAGELARAAIYVLPARYEPFGLSALEAALSGCALVLGDIPTLREIWGDAAIYIDTDDASALAKMVNELLQSTSVLEQWSEKAKNRALYFSAARMAHDYWQLYQQAVKEKQALHKEEIV